MKYNALFCLPCTRFGTKKSKFTAKKDFQISMKINEKVLKHVNMDHKLENGASSSGKHSSMMQKAEDLKQRFDKPNSTIPYNFDSIRFDSKLVISNNYK